jgi:hypothetical protein
MKRCILALSAATLLAFAGPCFPNNYFSSLISSAGVAVSSALLSDVFNTLFPPVSSGV